MRTYGGDLKYKGKWYENDDTEFVQITIYPKKGFKYDIEIQVPSKIYESEEKTEDFIEWWVKKNLKGVQVWLECDGEYDE